MDEVLTLEFDGGSRGNPGPAGIGVVVRAADGTPLVTLGRFIGRATNNVAEYKALITALQQARQLGAKKVIVRGDSELVVRQMRGEYRVKNADLRTLYDEAQALVRQFSNVTFDHNYRHKNAQADKLANLAMDKKAEVTDVNGSGDAADDARGAKGAGPSALDEPSPVAPEPGDRFACARCGCVIELVKPSSIRPHQLKPFACQCGAKMQPAPGTASQRGRRDE
jgi:ribonuclease HI